MFPSLNLSAFHPTAGQRTSIGSSTNASSMCSLTSGDESMSGTSSRRNTNTANGGVKKPAESRSTSAFLTPFSSTSSLFMQAAAAADNCMSSAQVRRISMPFHKVGNSAAARRLSHIVSSVGDAVNQELMLFGDKPSSQPPFGPDLNREWEIVTVRELCRRLSLEDSFEPSEMPLPEGSQTSQVFDEFMIRQIVDILPPRAEGYPWVKIYSSEKHGFSLATLYRKMSEWTEEMSPVLLVVRDVSGHVFGAVASTALRPNEHYYGTGDSCILFRFTGEFPTQENFAAIHGQATINFSSTPPKTFCRWALEEVTTVFGWMRILTMVVPRNVPPLTTNLWLEEPMKTLWCNLSRLMVSACLEPEICCFRQCFGDKCVWLYK